MVVADGETLYRAVRFSEKVDGPDEWIASSAFQDREDAISVNRAAIWPDPLASRQEDTDGVIALLTRRVREIRECVGDAKSPKSTHRAEVSSDPVLGSCVARPNPSHAVMHLLADHASGALPNDGAQRRFRHSLANLVTSSSYVVHPIAPPTPG